MLILLERPINKGRHIQILPSIDQAPVLHASDVFHIFLSIPGAEGMTSEQVLELVDGSKGLTINQILGSMESRGLKMEVLK